MSQPPFGPPGQNQQYPPYQPGPQQGQPAAPYGPPQGQYGPPPQGPPFQGPPQYGPPSQGPGFGWGPGFGGPGGSGGPGGPGWQPRRPRKKSKAPLIVILSLVGVGIVGAGLIGIVRQAAKDTTHPPVVPTRYTPKPTTESTGQPTEEPTSTATESPTSEPKVNDATVVSKNAIYKVGQMRTANCREPKVRPTNARNAAAYWAAIKPCLDRSWGPLVTKAGYKFQPPSMSYWSGSSTTTPCGSGVVNVPFYCSSNNNLYMKVDVFVKSYTQYSDAESKAYARMWYTRSVAHEYGHSVQNMTGILQASDNLRYELSDYNDRQRQTRRMELQANCFAGVFLAMNKKSYPISGELLYVWNKWVVTAGDKPEDGDHGSVASQQRFMGQSFKTGNPASCNTFAVSPRYVS
ncbi:neutral zinc metallopeptidase [Kribbella hippodromi]|uniref:neutral zinc metallopeptidase n=1 Tax=Kribbella hippodromi TaxID=434347 RepID=UPI0031CE25A0